MKHLFFASVFLVSCGSQLPETKSQPVASETKGAISLDKKSDMPECRELMRNQLIYIVESKQFFVCNDDWEAIKIAGKNGTDGENGQDGTNGKDGLNGKDGRDGVQGVAGTDGIDGQDGAQGIQGTQGVAGAQGAQGAQGTAGIDGEDGMDYMPNLVDSQARVIGRLAGIDAAGTFYLVIREDGVRMEISRAGSLREVQYVFSGPNCTGERRSVRINGLFANVTNDSMTNKAYKQVGSYANNWPYLSRSNGACTAQTGTVNRGYLVEEITIENRGSWGEVEISN